MKLEATKSAAIEERVNSYLGWPSLIRVVRTWLTPKAGYVQIRQLKVGGSQQQQGLDPLHSR